MPKVGNKEFPYTDKGRGQAEVYAAQTGQTVTSDKDSFGYGTYQEGGDVPSGGEATSKEDVRQLLDVAKMIIAKGERLPDNVRQAILNVPMKGKDLYGGFFSLDEDFAEEVDTLKSYVAGDFKQRKDGRYEWGSLLLDEGETPESWIMNSYPMEGMQRGGQVKRYGYQTGGISGQGLDYSETLNDEKQMFRDKEGNYTVNLAKQYETPEGLRYYEGTGKSPDMFFAESMAETDARRVLHDNPADSLVTGGKQPYAKDGLIRSILGKFGF